MTSAWLNARWANATRRGELGAADFRLGAPGSAFQFFRELLAGAQGWTHLWCACGRDIRLSKNHWPESFPGTAYFKAKLVNKPAARPVASDVSRHYCRLRGGFRTWSAPPSDSLRPAPVWSLRRNGGRVNVGIAYRLFFDVVPLRASRTEGLSGQYTIGATDSYNARVHDGWAKNEPRARKIPAIA